MLWSPAPTNHRHSNRHDKRSRDIIPAGRGGAARAVMFRLKRLDRGLVISAIGHLGLLAIGLLYLGASAHEAPPPEATLVELVRPQDIPHFSGAPTDLRTSGIDAPAPKSQP